MPKRKVTGEVVECEDEGKVPPAVLFYPSGVGLENSGKVAVYKNPKTHHQVVIRQEEVVDYVGTTWKAASEASFTPCKYAVGVFNKKNGTLKFAPILGEQIFRMEPKLHNLDYGASSLVTDFGDLGRWQGNKRLIDRFGASKIRKKVKDIEMGYVDAKGLQSGGNISDMVGAIGKSAQQSGTTREQVIASLSFSRNIPPHHPDAVTGDDAYKFQELCPPTLWEHLKPQLLVDAANDEQKQRKMRQSGDSTFVIGHLEELVSMSDSKKQKKRAVRLSFVRALLHFLKVPSTLICDAGERGIFRLSKRHKMNRNLFEYLLEKFYNHRSERTGSKFERPASNKTLLQMYVLVVALSVNDYVLDPEKVEALRAEMGLQLSTMKNCFKQLGCVIAGAAGTSTLTVRLLVDKYDEPRTLADCFPALDLMTGPGRGGR